MKELCKNINLKIIIFIGAIVFALLLCVVAVNKVSASEYGQREKMITSVSIKDGDTLWTIAEAYYCDEYESMDDYIEDIMSINNISSTKIVAGNYILVPYYE